MVHIASNSSAVKITAACRFTQLTFAINSIKRTQECFAYFFKNALNKSIGSGRNVVVLCSLAISRMVWR